MIAVWCIIDNLSALCLLFTYSSTILSHKSRQIPTHVHIRRSLSRVEELRCVLEGTLRFGVLETPWDPLKTWQVTLNLICFVLFLEIRLAAYFNRSREIQVCYTLPRIRREIWWNIQTAFLVFPLLKSVMLHFYPCSRSAKKNLSQGELLAPTKNAPHSLPLALSLYCCDKVTSDSHWEAVSGCLATSHTKLLTAVAGRVGLAASLCRY